VGMTSFRCGHNNDAAVLINESVNLQLALVGMKALCDKAFGRDTFISPLPKAGQNINAAPSQLSALCKIRVTVEWCFGEVFARFPYLKDRYKAKVFQTSPSSHFVVGVILTNCLKCFRGCNSTTYFSNATPLTIQEYLRP
jgi:hypothetical protein